MDILFSLFFIWLPQFLYFVCFVPQLVKNYKLKSVEGYSDFFLFGYTIGFFFYGVYVFALPFPLAYRIMSLCQISAIILIISQRLYYPDKRGNNKIYAFLMSFLTLFISMIIMLSSQVKMLGSLSGWILTGCLLITPLTQIRKIYLRKNTRGFSLGFVLIFLGAALCDLVAAYVLALPVQTYLYTIKSIIVNVVFCYQFAHYR